MRSFNRLSFLFVLFIILSSILIITCRKAEEEQFAERGAAEPSAAALKKALVTFISGVSFVLQENDWQPLGIGDYLQGGDTVKVAEDSYCELQFGDLAAVRIEANTILAIEELFLESGAGNIALNIAGGSVLYKVGKLRGDQKFDIKTMTAVMGIRGTRFGVRVDERGGTLLAVKSGVLQIMPASIAVDGLMAKLPEKEERVLELLQKIGDSAYTVVAEQEILIAGQTLMETEAAFKELEELVDSIIAEMETTISEEQLRLLDQRVNAVIQSVAVSVAPPVELSEESRKALEAIEWIRMINIPDVAAGIEQPELVAITLLVEPEDAEILLNCRYFGKGAVSGIFNRGEELSFVMHRQGYLEKILELTVAEDSVLEVKLEKLKEVIPQEGPAAEISITTLPGDALILINGEPVGRGDFSSAFPLGNKLLITVCRDGYEEKRLNITVTEGGGSYEVSLDLLAVVGSLSLSRAALAGELCIEANKVVGVDAEGTIVLSDMKGAVLRRVSLGENTGYNSFPLISGDRAYFIGNRRFVVADINSGELLKRLPVESGAAYNFGRRVAIFNNRGIFPDNDRIKVFDLNSGDLTAEIKIPDGSIMSPQVQNERIIMVNKKGIVLKIDEQGGFDSIIPTGFLKDSPLFSTLFDDLILISSSTGSVVAVDLVKGEVLWQQQLPLPAENFCALTCGESGLYALYGDVLYALSLERGEELFKPISRVSAPPLYSTGKLFLGRDKGRLDMLNGTTGVIEKSLLLDENITTTPVLWEDKLLVGTEGGKVIIINPAGIK
jgi:outer membrane protein assembly factor BamB